jgi:hypothetical protein
MELSTENKWYNNNKGSYSKTSSKEERSHYPESLSFTSPESRDSQAPPASHQFHALPSHPVAHCAPPHNLEKKNQRPHWLAIMTLLLCSKEEKVENPTHKTKDDA